jgi:hypothetical protein
MTDLPHIKPGSVLRATKDGKRYLVRSIHKAEAHSGFSQVIMHEPGPMPFLEPNKAPRRKKKPYRKPRWFR